MSVKVLRDYVVVVKEKTEEAKSPSGLITVVSLEEKHVAGKIVAVGSGRMVMNGTIIPLEVQVGDRVLFNKSMATEVKDGADTVFVLREDQLICVLT